MNPVISIGMPVRNCSETLTAAVRSILLQTFEEWEMLLIVDGGDRSTANVATDLAAIDTRIRLRVEGASLGLAARLNQAIDDAAGRFFARMDGDDVSYPSRLETQLRLLSEDQSVDLVGSPVVVFAGHGALLGKRDGSRRHDEICRRPYSGFGLAHPTYCGRIEFFRRFRYRGGREAVPRVTREGRIEMVAGNFLRSEDYDLLLRSYRQARFQNVPEILLGYREDRLSVSTQWRSRYLNALAAAQQAIADRRYRSAAVAIANQAVKFGVDATAILTGTEARLLSHRYRPVSESEQREWERVWSCLASDDYVARALASA